MRSEDSPRFVPLETIITLFAERLLVGYSVQGAWPFRVTRDADIEVDDEEEERVAVQVQSLHEVDPRPHRPSEGTRTWLWSLKHRAT